MDTTLPSIIKDPFELDNIIGITIYSFKSFNGFIHTGHVEFKNGDSRGKQEFKGDSTQDVIIKIFSFIEELNNKNDGQSKEIRNAY